MRSSTYLRNSALFMITLIISLPVIFAENINTVISPNGNLITGDSYYREYNELNQLVRVREGNQSDGEILEEFIWHPTEEKILKKKVYESGILNQEILYINENYIVIENSSGTFNETYVYQNGQLVAQVKPDGSKESLHPDHLGSTSLILDSSGSVVENSWYSPFGEIVVGGQDSRFGYEGKEFDEETKDTDFHFRKYRPDWGKFVQPDTLIPNVYNPQSLNRYAFERNNPYGHIDEDGHQFLWLLENILNPILEYIWGEILQKAGEKIIEDATSPPPEYDPVNDGTTSEGYCGESYSCTGDTEDLYQYQDDKEHTSTQYLDYPDSDIGVDYEIVCDGYECDRVPIEKDDKFKIDIDKPLEANQQAVSSYQTEEEQEEEVVDTSGSGGSGGIGYLSYLYGKRTISRNDNRNSFQRHRDRKSSYSSNNVKD